VTTPGAGPITVEVSIRALGFSLRIGFNDIAAYELAERFLFGRISGARLPRLEHTVQPPGSKPALWIDLTPESDECARVRFRGEVESPQYVAQLDGFHWDFSKVLNAFVMSQSLSAGLVPVHAAAIATPSGVVLLPGASGAGKSSVSYAALTRQMQVFCSELGFLQDDLLMCGNQAVTIDREAIRRFDLGEPDQPHAMESTRLQISLNEAPATKISAVAFLHVSDGPLRIRSITDRRARMLLFENIVTQLPMTQLLAQETWPLWRPPSRRDIDGVMDTVQVLSTLEPVIVEGHPVQIIEYLASDA
jgi:hypothetical protein